MRHLLLVGLLSLLILSLQSISAKPVQQIDKKYSTTRQPCVVLSSNAPMAQIPASLVKVQFLMNTML